MNYTASPFIIGKDGYTQENLGFKGSWKSENFDANRGELIYFFKLEDNNFLNYFTKNGFCIELREPVTRENVFYKNISHLFVKDKSQSSYTYVGVSYNQHKVLDNRLLFVLEENNKFAEIKEIYKKHVKSCDGTICTISCKP
jgi:hypothetical protein